MSIIKENYNKYGVTLIEMLEQSLDVKVPVFGLSMFPCYLPDDTVVVRRVEFQNLKRGDVIVFVINDQIVAHRLLKIDREKGKAISKGDGMLRRDRYLLSENILGTVIKHQRKGKDQFFVNTLFVKRIMTLISPIFGIFFSLMGKIWFKLAYKK